MFLSCLRHINSKLGRWSKRPIKVRDRYTQFRREWNWGNNLTWMICKWIAFDHSGFDCYDSRQIAALGNSFDFSIVICQSFSLKLELHSFAFVWAFLKASLICSWVVNNVASFREHLIKTNSCQKLSFWVDLREWVE